MTQQLILDDSDLRRYRTEIPNMADDELNPYQYRLYAHYKRVCGASATGMCYESVRTTAAKTKMSAAQVSDTSHELAREGWIEIHAASDVQYTLITIVDRWLENTLRFAPDERLAQLGLSRSHGEQIDLTVHHMNSRSPHELKKFVVVVDSDLLNLEKEQKEKEQQQDSSLNSSLDSSSTPILVNGDLRFDHLIRIQGLLDEGINLADLEEWVKRYGAETVHLKARWYLYVKILGKARGGGWLRDCIEQGWTDAPSGFASTQFLSPAEIQDYYTSGKYAEEIDF